MARSVNRPVTDDDEDEGSTVVRLPSFTEIPMLTFPLCDEAQIEYITRCQQLLERGQLTQQTREWVESLALSTHDIQRALARGTSTQKAIEQRSKAFRQLSKLDADRPIPTSRKNPYEAFGFAERVRRRRHD